MKRCSTTIGTLTGMLIMLAGCASVPPASYYTLNMTPGSDTVEPIHIEIGRIAVSEALARRNLLIKKSPTEIEYYASDQWVAGLEELVAEKLAVEFQNNTNAPRTLYLTGSLMAFGQVDRPGGADAHLKMAIHVTNEESGDTVLRKTYEIVAPAASPTPLAVVDALSYCLESLAKQIREAL